jgi:hypothetical protein
MGWLGRYLESVPFDPLVGWSATRELPRALMSREVSVPAIPDARTYAFNSPNAGAEAMYERTAATRIASHVPLNRPQVAFVNGTAVGALATLDRVASVSAYTGTVAYPGGNNALAAALRTVAGSIAQGTGTRVYWVQTGGYDTHANQNAANSYPNLMATLGAARRHLDAGVLRIRPSSVGKRRRRECWDGSRRRRRDDGDGRSGARRHLRHRTVARSEPGEPDAREQRRRRALRDRLPVGVRAGHHRSYSSMFSVLGFSVRVPGS